MSQSYAFILLCFSIIFAPEAKALAQPLAAGKPEVISIDSINLTAELFWQAYISDNEADKYAARFYLLGVMDSTEGKSWCSYKQFKTISLRDYLNGHFSHLSEAQMQLRAAVVIENALIELNKCKANL